MEIKTGYLYHINDELEDELFYNELINNAPSEIEKEIIKDIRNDEREHNKILRNLYFQFTGKKNTIWWISKII